MSLLEWKHLQLGWQQTGQLPQNKHDCCTKPRMPLGQQIHYHYILGNACSLRAVPLSQFCFVPYYEETLNCKRFWIASIKSPPRLFSSTHPLVKKNGGCHLERGHRNNKVLCFQCLQHRWHQLGFHPQGEWEISPDSKNLRRAVQEANWINSKRSL